MRVTAKLGTAPRSVSRGLRVAAVHAPLAPPLIYYILPGMVGPLPEWQQILDRVAAAGFDTVLLGSLATTENIQRLHPALVDDSIRSIDDFLCGLVAEIERRGLRVFADLALDSIAATTLPVRDGRAALPDPRRQANAADVDVSGNAMFREAARSACRDSVRHLTRLGIAGYRCLRPDRCPSDLWQDIIEESGDAAVFCAWTPGLAPGAVDALGAAGFRLSFGSTPWWDLRASWLVEEYRDRRLSVPSIGVVEEPAGRRFAAAARGSVDQRRRAALRRLWAAVGTGFGYLMPMGFDFGTAEALDPATGRPEDWRRAQAEAMFDLTADLTMLNATLKAEPVLRHPGAMLQLTAADAPVTVIARSAGGDFRAAPRSILLAINTTDHAVAAPWETVLPHLAGDFGSLSLIGSTEGGARRPPVDLVLGSGEATLYGADRKAATATTGRELNPAAMAAAPRIVIERVSPDLGDPELVVKRLAGEAMVVEADIFSDGHESLRAVLMWRRTGERGWQESPMLPIGNDRWRGTFPLSEPGRYRFGVEAWRDLFGTWRDDVEKKRAAGQALAAELQEGSALIRDAAKRHHGKEGRALEDLVQRSALLEPAAALSLLLDDAVVALMARCAERTQSTRRTDIATVMADRRQALFASWYELFPRSQSGDPSRHGTFEDVIRQLPDIHRMGFDVLYFPPIHPIGRTNRKGRNNALTAAPGDPGSPYAIGDKDGGHDAVHAELGGLDAFRRMVHAAAAHGIEIALDFAVQCSPDHPWLKQHPRWFSWRPDGSIRYAENPPKKYEDIVNVDFYAKEAIPDLWHALRDVVMFWIGEGVRTFRVDNPHTKPLPFWAWLIGSVHSRHPDVLFLAEAFTRPKMMQRLGKIGFSQSYTYFTWRNTKAELTEYATEIAETEMRDYFRPNYFVNTPDINPIFLQTSGRPGFLIRAALAATLSGLWGIYSGFEVCEGRALPGKEEYLDSEKYQIRVWDRRLPGNIVAEISRLNRIRRANPALQTHLGISFLNCANDQVLCFRKATPSRDNVVLVLVSLDPHGVQDATFEVPLWEFGLPDHGTVQVEDLVHDSAGSWTGKLRQHRLDPSNLPFAIWRIAPAPPVGA